MNVYKAINAVQRDLSKIGIAKDQRNTQGSGYNFRGIDSVYNALSPLLAEHGLCILPRMLSRTCDERTSKSGGALFYIVVEAEFDFVASEDGSKHTIKTFGEAMDSGDKGTNKAMSAAYKYAAFQAFAIPTEAADADADTHEVKGIDRTLVMKVRSRMQENIANDKPMSVNEEWEAAQEMSKEFAMAVWSGLTTPERDYVRAARPTP
jgi:ERF superfamily